MARVSFELEARPEGTRLTLIESGFASLAEGTGLEAVRRNTDGWNIQAEHIAAHVAGWARQLGDRASTHLRGVR